MNKRRSMWKWLTNKTGYEGFRLFLFMEYFAYKMLNEMDDGKLEEIKRDYENFSWWRR